jgi:ribosomal protein S27AE
MNVDNISCPKCGNLCPIPRGSFKLVYITICLLCLFIGIFTDLPTWLGIIGSLIVLFYYVSIRDKPIQCPKCGFSWRR